MQAGTDDPAGTLKGLLRSLTPPARGTRLGDGQVVDDPQAWVRSVRERAAWALEHHRKRPRAAWALAYLVREVLAAAEVDMEADEDGQEQLRGADRAFRAARASGRLTPLIQS